MEKEDGQIQEKRPGGDIPQRIINEEILRDGQARLDHVMQAIDVPDYAADNPILPDAAAPI